MAAPYSREFLVKDQIKRRYGQMAAAAARPQDAESGCGNPLEDLDIAGVATAVDLGCGAGRDAAALAGLLPPGALVIALDLTEAMAALARSVGVAPVTGDIEMLPLPGASVDLVIANASLNLVLERRRAFAEIYRVLKPGGRLRARDLLLAGALDAEIMKDPLGWNTSLGGVPEEAVLAGALSQAGFTGVVISGHAPFAPVVSVQIDAVKAG